MIFYTFLLRVGSHLFNLVNSEPTTCAPTLWNCLCYALALVFSQVVCYLLRRFQETISSLYDVFEVQG